jgi:predicted hotdog family 3-hydroxylacyl-ACP dehydratase
MKIDKEWIAAHIPHQGTMCLLDSVASWDQEHMTAIATSHSASDNPLRAHDRLGAANGIEYAAQAMAVHSALLATSKADATNMQRPQAGFLVSVRNTTFHVARLDDINEPLQIEVVCTHSEPNCILYQFTVSGHDTQTPLLDGRATIIIDATMVTNNTGVSTS